MIQTNPITYKTGHNNKRSGTKRTGRVPHKRHHHENRKDISDEKHLQDAIRGNISTVDIAENPLPEIESLSNDEISQAIRSVVGGYDDAFQDVWVEVIERGLQDVESIKQTSRTIYKRHSNDAITKRHKEIFLETKLSEDSELILLDRFEGNPDGGNPEIQTQLSPRRKRSTGFLHNPEMLKEVLKFRADGLSYRQIIRAMRDEYDFSISQGCVGNWCRGNLLGIIPSEKQERIKEKYQAYRKPHNKYNNEVRNFVFSLRVAGYTYREIADAVFIKYCINMSKMLLILWFRGNALAKYREGVGAIEF